MTIGGGYTDIYKWEWVRTASGRSDKDTGLGQTVMKWVTQLEIVGWLLVGEGEGGVGWGNGGPRRVDKQRPSQVRSDHSCTLRTSGRFREGRG